MLDQDIISENILESLPVGLLVIGPEGNILRANKSLAAILGHPLEQIIKQGWSQFFLEGNENREFNQIILDVIQKEIKHLKRHVPYFTPDGTIKYLDVVSSYIKKDKRLVAIVVLLDDVTEVHELYEREKRTLRENSRLQQERAEGLAKLAMSVAHQVRNPVSAIGGFANLLKRRLSENEKNRAYLQAIVSESSKLEQMVIAVRDYALLSRREAEKIDLKRLLRVCMRDLDAKAEEQGLRIQWESAVSPCEIHGDRQVLKEALSVILQNCLDFAAGPEIFIKVTCDCRQNNARITIRDRGKGVNPADLPYLFDPFFTTKASSTGMELARAKKIISEHRGELHAESDPGQGLNISVNLPRE